jgi:putative oxidoreductase
MTFEILVTLLARLSLVLLFLPFSALDKLLNFTAAVGQSNQAVSSRDVARALILVGLFVEVVMSLGVLTGVADRLAAFILAGYCATTALLWKPFWKQPDFRLKGPSKGRDMFWDFLKNFAVAGGFLMLTFGPNAGGVGSFFRAPLSSTHPYTAEPAP